MQRAIDALFRLFELIVVACLAAMVVMVFGNVVLRYAFNSGITTSEEVSRWLFVWLCFLGAVVAIHEHGHLGTDMLVGRLGRRGRRICLAVAQAVMIYVTWLVFSGSVAQARINWDNEAPVTGLSMAVFYGAGVVFAVPAALLLALQLWRTLSGRLRDDELVMVQESEDLAALHAQGGDAKSDKGGTR